MYPIGLFSKISKTTIKTLRYYDEVGLLNPAHVNMDNGYRYYTSDQLVILHNIIALRQIGFSIEETLLVLNGKNEIEILNQRKYKIEKELNEVSDKLSTNEYTIIENPRESYINGIWNKDNEEDWLTEIQVPVVKNK